MEHVAAGAANGLSHPEYSASGAGVPPHPQRSDAELDRPRMTIVSAGCGVRQLGRGLGASTDV
jgi:hypothetical protein